MNNTSKNSTANSSASTRCRPITRLGLGGVAIGNGFTPTSDEAAQHTLQAAIDAGIRYFDTSPWYGLGLSERRFGHALHTLKAEHSLHAIDQGWARPDRNPSDSGHHVD